MLIPMNDAVAVVQKIENGYLIVDLAVCPTRIVYTKDFCFEVLLNINVDHEKECYSIASRFPTEGGKIPAIKAVREYCGINNYGKCQGLREAKEFVESTRNEWKPKTW